MNIAFKSNCCQYHPTNTRIARIGVDFTKFDANGAPTVFLENNQKEHLGTYDNPQNNGIWTKNLLGAIKTVCPDGVNFKRVHVPASTPPDDDTFEVVMPKNFNDDIDETVFDLPSNLINSNC